MTPFYWRHGRDSLLTDTALRMFQLLAIHEGEKFDDIKDSIDADYVTAQGKSTLGSKHGGYIQTWIQSFRDGGWAFIDNEGLIQITPAGKQALILLNKAPDFIKAAPPFILELLSRWQLNNPARPATKKNADYEAQLKESTVFPYWTLLKIIRSSDNYITSDELRRFAFQIKKHEDISHAIAQIKEYRKDKDQGKSENELDAQYPHRLEKAVGEPKYLMGRLGTQVGKTPPVLEKEGPSTWRLNKYYEPVVDEILSNEPAFKDYLSEETWMRNYGSQVELDTSERSAELSTTPQEPLVSLVADDDPKLIEVKQILDAGNAGVLFSGPPGTSKSWYARQIAIKLVDGDPERVCFVQFHPSMAYDDFVEGYVPFSDGNTTSFEVRNKIFLKLCVHAKEVSPSLCVIVIDEINRGDASRIFGELLTYIESTYREVNFTTAYSGALISIPKNLFIIGTFNPFDKSVIELDDAMDRRFERLSFDPSTKILVDLLKQKGVETGLISKVAKYFENVNKLTRHGLGHTLFLNIKDDASLKSLWHRKLKFIFEKAFRFDPELFDKAKEEYLELFEDKSNIG